MLRSNFLVALGLAFLVSCAPSEPAGPAAPADSLGRTSSALVSTTITVPFSGEAGTCLRCRADGSSAYQCLENTDNNSDAYMQQTFMDPVPAGNLVVGATARVHGRLRNSGNNSENIDIDLNTQDLGTRFAAAKQTWCGTDKACEADRSITYPDTATGLPGYIHGALNTLKVVIPPGAYYCVSHIELTLNSAPRTLVFTTPPQVFGKQKNGTSTTQNIVVRNTGEAPIKNISATISNATGGTFTITPSTVAELAATATQTFVLTFIPSSVGPVTGNLTISSGETKYPTGNPQLTSLLSGTGVQHAVDVSPVPLAFEDQRVGATAATKTVTVTNAGTASFNITGVSVANTTGQTFAVTTSVGTGLTVAVGTSRPISVTFNPPDAGPFTGTLTITTSGTGADRTSVPVTLAGTGVKPTVELTATTLNFNEQRVGAPVTTANTRLLTVRNTGTLPLTISNPVLNGTGKAYYSLSSTPLSVPAGDSRDLTVTFNPLTEGLAEPTLTLTTDDPLRPTVTVALSGTGVKPTLEPLPASLALGEPIVGGTPSSTTTKLTLRNTGTGTLNVNVPSSISGKPFSISPNGVVPLTQNASVDLDVTFAPSIAGTFTGDLILTTNDVARPSVTVGLTGTGARPVLSVNPLSRSFGEQRVGSPSTGQIVTVMNTGTGTLKVNVPATIPGKPFTIEPDGEFNLRNGERQVLTVKFTPSDPGAVSADLIITSNDPASASATVALSGTGVTPTLSLIPSALAFGVQRVGIPSAPQTVTVTNSGNGTLYITSLSISPSFSVSPSGPFNLAAGVHKDLAVTFTPEDETSPQGTLTVNTNDPSSPNTVSLSGTGVKPKVDFEPTTLAFGEQRVGEPTARTVTVKNNGSGPIRITGISIAPASAPFTFSATETEFDLPVGASRNVTVTFHPGSEVASSANLTLTTNDSLLPFATLALSGTGVKPVLHLSPNTLAFGEQRVGTPSMAKTVTVTNTGSGTLRITGLSFSEGAPFTVSPSTGFDLVKDASQVLSVTFNPGAQAQGAATATLTLASNDPASPKTISLSGTGVKPTLLLSPATLAFGAQRVGISSAPQTVTVTNTGTGTLYITSLSISPSFSVSPSGPFNLAAGVHKDLSVTFTPGDETSPQGTLTVNTNDPDSLKTVSLSGTGVKPKVDFEPTTLAFGEQRVGDPSAPRTVTVKNNGSGPIRITGISIAPTSAPFTFSATETEFDLPVGASRNVTVTFSPGSEVASSANLILTTNDSLLPSATLALSGTGVKPVLHLSPNTLAFGEQRVGTPSTAKTVTVTNTGSGTLRITGLSFSEGAPFTVSPSTGFDLVKDASQVLSVRFNPGAEGDVTASLTLASNDPVSPKTIALSGIGVKPKLELRPTSLAFGEQLVGTTSAAKTVTVYNAGTGPVRVTGASTSNAFFEVAPFPAFDLAKGTERDLTVVFRATGKGEKTADLTLSTDEATASANVVSLSGLGVSRVVMNPTALDFKSVVKGSSLKLTVTLRNDSTVPVNITSVSSVVAPFLVERLNAPRQIPANSTIDFDVTFTPTTDAQSDAVLTLTSDAVNSPLSLTMSGKGAVAVAKLTLPNSEEPLAALDFKGVRVNAPKTLKVKLTNTGEARLITGMPTVSSPTIFTVPTTSMTLEPKASLEFDVSFRPNANATFNDTLSFPASNAANAPTPLRLSGFGADPKLELSTAKISFGSVRVGDSKSIPLKIRNTGNAEVTVQSYSIDPPFVLHFPSVKGPPPFTIEGLSEVQVDVLFFPTQKEPASGTVSFSNDLGTSLVVALDGKGTISEVKTNVTSLAFGPQRVKATSDSKTLWIQNLGEAELEITDIKPSTGFAFDLTGTDEIPLKIAAGAQKPVEISFTPNTLGDVLGQLDIISNAYTQSAPLSLTGKGVDGRLASTPDGGASFESVDVGGSGAQKTVTLTNAGDATLTISQVTVPAGSPFAISGLTPGTSVDAKQNVSFTVTFNPVRGGFASSTAEIRSDSVLSPLFYLTMTGTGVAPAVVLQNREINFGMANVGAFTTQPLTITNEGQRQLYVSNIAFADSTAPDGGTPSDGGTSGTESASLDFSVSHIGETSTGDAGVGTGASFPQVVEAGQSKIVYLKFSPRAAGLRKARALVYTNDKTAEANLMGEGTSPNLEISPLSLEFGNVLVDNSSAAKNIKITNKGNGSLSVSAMTVGGTDKDSFTLTKPGLPVNLQPGASTNVSVTFKPNAERRAFSAQLVVESTDPDAPSISVPMSGSGVRQQIQVSESALEFGRQLINHTSNARKVLVTNNSDTSIFLTAVTVEGTGSTQFAVVKPGLPFPLEPGQAQALEVGVTFTPLDESDVNCILKFNFNGLPQPLEVALHGKGTSSVFSIEPPSLDFGGVRAGGNKRELALTITNRSGDPIKLAEPEATTRNGVAFLYDTAFLRGRTIEPGMSVIWTVGYQPMEETTSETVLSFGTTTPPKPSATLVSLKGRATRRLLFSDQDSLDFGRLDLNKTVEPKTITISNKSAQQQQVVVRLKALEGSPFTLDTKALRDPIPAGGSAPFTVAFDPDKAGEAANEVEVLLMGENEAEVLIPVKGVGRAIKIDGGGCSCGTTETGAAGMLALLALVGLSSRRRRRE